MNASALLTSQGWLGPGHALDSRLTDYGAPTYKQKGHRGLAYDPSAASPNSNNITTGNGLVKPLLVSQRGGSRHGIGKKAHEPVSGNEWWLKGFQSALQNIGKSESERSSVVGSGTSTPRNGKGYVGKHSGLYGYFVTGQMMKGTLEEWDELQQRKTSKKRKSDVLEEEEDGRGGARAVSPVKRVQSAKELETSIEYLTERDRERRKAAHKRAQSTDVEQFAAVGAFLGATEDEKRKLKGRRKELEGVVDVESDARVESKEERRARRKRRKEGKENGKLTLAEMVEEELARLSSMNNSEQDDSSTNEKAVRKAERKKKRRKGGE